MAERIGWRKLVAGEDNSLAGGGGYVYGGHGRKFGVVDEKQLFKVQEFKLIYALNPVAYSRNNGGHLIRPQMVVAECVHLPSLGHGHKLDTHKVGF